MRQTLIFTTLFCLLVSGAACAQDEASGTSEAKPESLSERAGYAIGLNMGSSMKQQNVDIDVDAMIRGLRDGLAGNDGAMTQEELQATMQEFQQAMVAKQEAADAEAKTENAAAGDAFRADFGAQEGVTTLDSGVQYMVLTEGDGATPQASDQVTVHYQGTLVDGTQFDSSYERGQPATFPVTGVIPGWQEILQLMPVGSKWKVVIPPDQGYGDRGSPPRIGPASTLIFEVELLDIGAPETTPPAGESTSQGSGS